MAGRVGRETIDDVRLRYVGGNLGAGFGRDGYELDFGVDLVVYHDDNVPQQSIDVAAFQRLFVGVAWELPNDTSIGLNGVLGNVRTRRQRYSPSLYITHKFRPSERGAIYATGGVDYNYGNEGAANFRFVTHRFAAFASGTARLQVTPYVAAQLNGAIVHYKYVDDHHAMKDTYRSVSSTAAVLISISPTADITTFFSIGSLEDVELASGGLTVITRSR